MILGLIHRLTLRLAIVYRPLTASVAAVFSSISEHSTLSYTNVAYLRVRCAGIQEAREGVKTIAAAYEKAGVRDRFSWYIEEGTGHVLSEEMWKRTRQVFARHLRA